MTQSTRPSQWVTTRFGVKFGVNGSPPSWAPSAIRIDVAQFPQARDHLDEGGLSLVGIGLRRRSRRQRDDRLGACDTIK